MTIAKSVDGYIDKLPQRVKDKRFVLGVNTVLEYFYQFKLTQLAHSSHQDTEVHLDVPCMHAFTLTFFNYEWKRSETIHVYVNTYCDGDHEVSRINSVTSPVGYRAGNNDFYARFPDFTRQQKDLIDTLMSLI